MPDTNHEAGVPSEPSKSPTEPLSRLEEYLSRKTAELVPDSFERLTIVELTDNVHIVNDSSTQEGGAFNHDTNHIILRVRVERKSRSGSTEPVLVVTQDDRHEWVVEFKEMEEELLDTNPDIPDYLKILLANSVHEAMHGLTLQSLWNLNIVTHNELLGLAQEEINTRGDQEAVNKVLHDKWLSTPKFRDPESSYNFAVERKREMTKLLLQYLSEEHHEDYLRLAYYRGMSEIIAFTLQEKIRSSVKNPVEGYTGYFYSTRAAYMIYPSPEQHQRITELLKSISFPLNQDSIKILKSLGDISWFEAYKKSTE